MILENIKDNFIQALKKEMVNLYGMMVHIIKDNMLMIKNMEKENYLIDMPKF